MSTTIETITDEQIRRLGDEATKAGDHAQALICDIALGEVDAEDGYEHLRIWCFLSDSRKSLIRQLDEETARAECAKAIANAEAQEA